MFLCLLLTGAFRSQICEMKFNLAIFHNISSACNSASVEAMLSLYTQMKYENSIGIHSP